MTRNTRPVNSAWPQKSRPSWSKSRHDRGEEPTLGLGNISHSSDKGRTTAIAAALSPSKKPNHFAIAEAIAKKLQGRNHRPDKSGNISLVDSGQTRVTGNVPTCQLREIFPQVKQSTLKQNRDGNISTTDTGATRATVCDRKTVQRWKYFHLYGLRKNPRYSCIKSRARF